MVEEGKGMEMRDAVGLLVLSLIRVNARGALVRLVRPCRVHCGTASSELRLSTDSESGTASHHLGAGITRHCVCC